MRDSAGAVEAQGTASVGGTPASAGPVSWRLAANHAPSTKSGTGQAVARCKTCSRAGPVIQYGAAAAVHGRLHGDFVKAGGHPRLVRAWSNARIATLCEPVMLSRVHLGACDAPAAKATIRAGPGRRRLTARRRYEYAFGHLCRIPVAERAGAD